MYINGNGRKRSFALICCCFLLFSGVLNSSMACTSIFAGKDATADGAVIISRNEDMAGDWAKHFVVHERKEYGENDVVSFYNGLTVPQPMVAYKYTALPDWDTTEGPFEEAGINEFGVAISATNSAGTLETVELLDPFVEEGIGEEQIPTLVLPRVKTAREGIEVLGAMIEKYGSTSGYGLAIGDKDEVWYFEVGSGHYWVAVRVPDDKYLAVSNELRIGEFDLTDSKNYLGNLKINEFALNNNLIEEGQQIDFAKIFGSLGKLYNTRREWEVQRLLTPSVVQNGNEVRYPLFMVPDKKIEVKDVINVLTSKYEGTPYDSSLKGNEDERIIGVDRTVESHIIQLRSDMPAEVSGLMWLSMSNPEYGVYLPFYAGITKTPKAYQIGTDEFDLSSAYWTFKSLSVLAATNDEKYGAGVKAYWEKYQNKLLSEQKSIDEKVIELINEDKDAGVMYIDKMANDNANYAFGKAAKMRNELITELAKNSKKSYNPE